MRYISFDVRVGTAVFQVGGDTVSFHSAVAQNLSPGSTPERIGLGHVTPLTQSQILYEPTRLAGSVRDEIIASRRTLDMCLIDLSRNRLSILRDSLLIALADTIENLLRGGVCRSFVLLVPELPGEAAASTVRFRGSDHGRAHDFAQSAPLSLLSNSGWRQDFDFEGGEWARTEQPQHQTLVQKLIGSPTARLERRCVRRLGHFRTMRPPKRQAPCRLYSYFISGGTQECLDLLHDWWPTSNSDGILFDLGENPHLKDAVQAFAQANHMSAERIQDALDFPDVADDFKRLRSVTLVFDAVETGELLTYYAGLLEAKGITVGRQSLAAIVKGASDIIDVQGFQVHGFIAKPGERPQVPCPQCRLGLPHTREALEPAGPLRPFDMLTMCSRFPWAPEPDREIPPGQTGYRTLPNFERILSQDTYGGWIGYRLYKMLRAGPIPSNLIVVHPDQADSGQLVDRLLEWLDEQPTVVRIPREIFDDARGRGWTVALADHEGAAWYQALRDASGTRAAALMVDIFAASGGTLAALVELCKSFQIQAFAYASLVNFRPDMEARLSELTSIRSLYDWYCPRPAKRQAQS